MSKQSSVRPALISRVEMRDFKAVERQVIDLAPLSVVVGVNSSGKSTLIQAVLLLIQHLRDQYSNDLRISLNEDLVKLGTFKETARHSDSGVAETFEVAVTVNLPDETRLRRSRILSAKVGGFQPRKRRVRWSMTAGRDSSEMSQFAALTSLEVSLEHPEVNESLSNEPDLMSLMTDIDQQYQFQVMDIGLLPPGKVGAVLGDRSMLRSTSAREITDGSSHSAQYVYFQPGQPPQLYRQVELSNVLSTIATNVFTSWFTMRSRNTLRQALKTSTTTGGEAEKSHKSRTQLIVGISETVLEDVSDLLNDFLALEDQFSSLSLNSPSTSSPEPTELREVSLQRDEALSLLLRNFQDRVSSAVMASGRTRAAKDVDIQIDHGDEFKVFQEFQSSFDRVAGVKDAAVTVPLRATEVEPISVDRLSRHNNALGPSPEISYVRGELSHVIRSVHYLGPIRDIDAETPTATVRRSLGRRGEHAANVLQREMHERVNDAPLPPGWITKGRPVVFIELLSSWLRHLELADRVELEERGRNKAGIRVARFRPSGGPEGLSSSESYDWIPITSVGVGVSQVLPVIMQCLLAEPETSLVVIEQPELHLHPRIEQKLADFFVACARTGRQIFIETHSEHLINRLRLKVAQDVSGATRESVSVFFANQDPVTGVTSYDLALINEVGGLEGGWPEKFIDLSTEESLELLKVAVERRRTEIFGEDDPDDF